MWNVKLALLLLLSNTALGGCMESSSDKNSNSDSSQTIYGLMGFTAGGFLYGFRGTQLSKTIISTQSGIMDLHIILLNLMLCKFGLTLNTTQVNFNRV